MTHFLLTYERATQTADIRSFEDALAAFDAFAELEKQFMGDDEFEIVLLAAETLEDLRVTHPNFFTPGDMLPV